MPADPQRINPRIAGYPGDSGGCGSASTSLYLANEGAGTNDGTDAGAALTTVIPLQCPQVYNRVDVYRDNATAATVVVLGKFDVDPDSGLTLLEEVWLPLRAVENVEGDAAAQANYELTAAGPGITQDNVLNTVLVPWGSVYLDGASEILVLVTSGNNAARQTYVKLSTGS